MDAKKFIDRRKRRENKQGLKTILKLLHLHPCYFMKLYEKLDASFEAENMNEK